jgi:hypothetical protein
MSIEKDLLEESSIEKQILLDIFEFNIYLKHCFDAEERRAMAMNDFIQHMARKYRNRSEVEAVTKEEPTEEELIVIAEGPDDAEANKAMKELRERFDPNYVWCPDLDYAVVKMDECEKITNINQEQ